MNDSGTHVVVLVVYIAVATTMPVGLTKTLAQQVTGGKSRENTALVLLIAGGGVLALAMPSCFMRTSC